MESTQIRQYNGHSIATALHDTGSNDIVIFCHGYRSSTIGPNRFFVRAARKLAEHNISSLRFDQYGSGNSEGDFINSSFTDWVTTTKFIAQDYLGKGYRVALFGQSMGGSTVIMVASELPELLSMIAWVPDASADEFIAPKSGVIEESGQIVQASFWQEAHNAKVGESLIRVKAPSYIVQCSADEYVNEMNRAILIRNAQPNHTVDGFEGYSHSSWTFEQSEDIIDKSVDFLVRSFKH